MLHSFCLVGAVVLAAFPSMVGADPSPHESQPRSSAWDVVLSRLPVTMLCSAKSKTSSDRGVRVRSGGIPAELSHHLAEVVVRRGHGLLHLRLSICA
jgi:hypothetical protein